MKLIFFSKAFKNLKAAEYIQKAVELGLDGFELCVRPGYAVSPDNITEALPPFAAECRKGGIDVPLITANIGDPADPLAEKFLSAMDKSNVRMLRLAYYYFGRHKDISYWAEVDKLKKKLETFTALAKKYGVKLMYHTHSSDEEGPNYMGSNASNLMHVIKDLDPKHIGAFLDPAHLRVEGEQFDFATAITKTHFSGVALKDVNIGWDDKHYRVDRRWVKAGIGMVEWDLVFSELVRLKYDGILSVHGEYKVANDQEFFEQLPKEVAFFKDQLKKAREENTPKYAALSPKW